jgi:arginase
MPAVDSRQPGGMTYAELGDILAELIRSHSAAGMEITILDPDLDPDGSVIDGFVTFLEGLFAVL